MKETYHIIDRILAVPAPSQLDDPPIYYSGFEVTFFVILALIFGMWLGFGIGKSLNDRT